MASDTLQGSSSEIVTGADGKRLVTFGTIPLAMTSLAAAAIHFSVTGDHFDVGVLHGLFFVVVAWAQALWAVFMFVAPSRLVLVAGLLGNTAVIATWAVSRTVGVPVGPEAWTPEAVGGADLVATMLELVLVVGCGLLLARRTFGRSSGRLVGSPALALGLALGVLTSAAIATGAGHSHSGTEAAGHHAASDEAAGVGGHGHAIAGGSGRPDLFQLETIKRSMKKYRDVDAAFAAGWEKEHPDWPRFGSHFYREGDWDESGPARPELEITDPEFLMYSKHLTGDWKLVAVAYVVDQALYPDPPTDLKGATYHEHVWNCILDGEELEEEDWGIISQEECDEMGGEWSPGGVWMTHVWLVNNPYGIFAETNPLLV